MLYFDTSHSFVLAHTCFTPLPLRYMTLTYLVSVAGDHKHLSASTN